MFFSLLRLKNHYSCCSVALYPPPVSRSTIKAFQAITFSNTRPLNIIMRKIYLLLLVFRMITYKLMKMCFNLLNFPLKGKLKFLYQNFTTICIHRFLFKKINNDCELNGNLSAFSLPVKIKDIYYNIL